MKGFRIGFAFLSLMLVVGLQTLHADEWDKATKITFSESVQVPGTVSAPGTHVFKLLNSSAERHVVQIFNEDHTKLITTVPAIPNERLEPAGKTILSYEERPSHRGRDNHRAETPHHRSLSCPCRAVSCRAQD